METGLTNLLLKKWDSRSLGHFYILRGDKKDCNAFMEDFLRKVLPEGSEAKNNPDILLINKGPDKKHYSWDNDFDELFSFIKFSSLELPKKIIVLSDAHLLTQDISNKILRTLEELNDAVFFFLTPNQITLLPTIESRAVTLRIPKSDPQISQVDLYSMGHFKDWLKTQNKVINEQLPILMESFSGVQNFLEELKEDSDTQTQVFDLLLEWESNHLSDYKHKLFFLEEVRRFQTSLTYNNLFKERFVSLLSSCQVK